MAVCASDGTNRLAPAGWHCQSWHSLQPFYTLTYQIGAPFCEGPAFIQIQFPTIGYLLMGVMTTNHRQHIVIYVISGIFFLNERAFKCHKIKKVIRIRIRKKNVEDKDRA